MHTPRTWNRQSGCWWDNRSTRWRGDWWRVAGDPAWYGRVVVGGLPGRERPGSDRVPLSAEPGFASAAPADAAADGATRGAWRSRSRARHGRPPRRSRSRGRRAPDGRVDRVRALVGGQRGRPRRACAGREPDALSGRPGRRRAAVPAGHRPASHPHRLRTGRRALRDRVETPSSDASCGHAVARRPMAGPEMGPASGGRDRDWILGVDVGGTKTAVVAGTRQGEVLERRCMGCRRARHSRPAGRPSAPSLTH